MDRDPIKTVVRCTARKRRLGEDTVCVHCGQGELECLIATKVIEKHHVPGRAHDEETTITLCRNCHAIYSEGQLREGVPLNPQSSLIETVIAMLRGFAAFFRQVVGSFERMIEMLETTVLCFDTSHPEWRETCATQN